MIGISSPYSTPSTALAATQVKPKHGSHEANSAEFGPVVTTAMSAGQARPEAASATVSFSERGLNALADAGNSALDSMHHLGADISDLGASAVHTVENGVASLGHALGSAEDAAMAGVHMAEDTLASAAHSVSNAFSSVGSGVTSVATTLGGYMGDVAASAGRLLSDVA